MKTAQASLIFLKAVLVLLALLAFAFCLFTIPGMASRDAAAHPETAYLQYPFLLSAYLLFGLFFTALYQTFKLLSFISRNQEFSIQSVRALKMIKYCALITAGIFVAGLLFLIFFIGGDIAGLFTMSTILIIASSAVSAFAAVLEKLTAKAIRMKAENELTV
ncbi:DUF2975 domain-containing protein [Planococcus sp. CPCC 101016]|uniref:DUF2975 domain-containing protein n=1 Tax=Planococcus sp. CPCC 101016 TaxID=2599617 RepID=UPI0011B5878E|nr:DUF2975 domain-containing protein [Planococcus sp. CPCC 101016]TWT05362.1 DUF2975 domain-containing protein [Planococcus sp. CPCC 101016]